MRSFRRLLLIAVCAAWALSCTDSGSNPIDDPDAKELPDLSGLPTAPAIVDGPPPAVCGLPTEVGLMLGPNLATGSVTVANDESNLYVTYRSDEGRPILATALWVGDSPDEIPVNRWGLPRILRFPYASGHGSGTSEVVWEVPLADVTGPEAVIAAFGQIGFLPSWGAGEPITPDRDWAMYFTHTITDCGAESIGPEGGTVRDPDDRAVFQVPAGALTEAVAITVEPATFEEVQARVEEILATQSAASPASTGPAGGGGTGELDAAAGQANAFQPLPTLAGVIQPIANTFWDFGPDGLEFLESATVTLTYRDEDIPPGVPETELGVFVINGVIPYDRVGVVDPVANTVTAPVDHFSYFFVGYLDALSADLDVTAAESADAVPVGEEVRYFGEAANLGPDEVDVDITYRAFGNVTAGTLGQDCTLESDDVAFADVLIRCPVGPIPPGQVGSAPPAIFVPQAVGVVDVWVEADFAGVDPNPDNDRYTDSFTALDPRPQADLAVIGAVESADPIEVGLGVTYTATVENFGTQEAPNVSVRYSAFGDVEVGAIGQGCSVVDVPVIVDVQVDCPVGAVAPGSTAEAPPVEFIPGAMGDYTFWIEPFSIETDDPDIDNDRLEETVSVIGRTADLQIQAVGDNPDPAPEGSPVEYLISVVAEANAQAVEGARVVLNHSGNATFVSGSDEGCQPFESFVTCPVGPLPEGLIQEVSITLQPDEGLAELVVLATVNGPFDVTEVDDSNNTEPEVTTIDLGLPDADLTITAVTESADPVEVGVGSIYTGSIQNLGPAEVPDARVTYSGFGDLAVGSVGENCTVVATPLVADVQVECTVGTLPTTLEVQADPVEFIPQSEGEFTIWVEPTSDRSTTDPNTDNNRIEETLTAVGPTADLQMQNVSDNPDPAAPGDTIEYLVSVVAAGNAQPVAGANLALVHSGNATFVSATATGCTTTATSVNCPVPEMPNGLIQEIGISLEPNPGLTQLSVATAIQAPAGVTDPDLSNNQGSETTTIEEGATPTEGVDLAMTGLTGPTAPLAQGASFSLQATFENIGTDPASNVVFRYLIPTQVEVGSVPTGCVFSPSSFFADREVSCSYPSVASGASVVVPAVGLVASGLGTVEVGGFVFAGGDADPANNRQDLSITINPGEADLGIDRFEDSPDPVQPGDLVTYEVDIGLAGTAPVTDGRLRLVFTGDADFFGASVGCTQSPLRTWTCVLDPIDPGVPQTVQLQYFLTTGGSTVTVDAEVFSLGSITDPNPANDVATTSTTVESVGVIPITKGEVIEEILPAGGSSAVFAFDAVAGEQLRVSLAMISGPNPTGDLVVYTENGDTIFGNGTLPARADELSSENHVLTMPFTGSYRIGVESLGSGFFRVGLGTEIGRGDLTYGDPDRIYRRVAGTSSTEQYLLDMEAVGDGVLVFGSRRLTMLDGAGQFDGGFGSGGEVELSTVYAGPARAFAVQPDGRIVVVFPGFSSPYPWVVARFNADGSVDTGFGTNGLAQVQVGSGAGQQDVRPYAVGFIQDGVESDIVVAGRSASSSDQVGILRLNPDGTPDAGFGVGGVVVDNLGFAPTTAAIQPDGRILVGDSDQLARYTSSGARDTSFGGSGVVALPANGVVKVVPLPGGDIMAVGESGDDALAIRLDPNGSPAAFGSGGAVLVDIGTPERFQDVVEDAFGNLVLAGYERTPDGRYDQLLVRLTGSGVPDGGFGHAGFTIEGNTLDDGRAVAFDSQGRILVGGMGRAAFGLTVSRHLVN